MEKKSPGLMGVGAGGKEKVFWWPQPLQGVHMLAWSPLIFSVESSHIASVYLLAVYFFGGGGDLIFWPYVRSRLMF